MKTCEAMLFGISIDEDILFKASLVVFCFLFLLLILIWILIVWLRKIQRRITGLTKNTCSLPLVISSKKAANFKEKKPWKNLVVSAAYGPLSSDGNGPCSDLPQETSFDNSLAQGNDGKSVHGSKTQEESIASDNNDASNVQNVDDSSAAHYSTSNHSEKNIKGDKLKKDYMSLKGAKDHTYTKPGADSSRVESEMGCDERHGKALNEEKNDNTHEEDHGYLVVIYSDKSSALSEGTVNEMHPHEDESPLAVLEEDREYEYLSSQHMSKLTTFGHNAEFQQTQPGVSKDIDEDYSGYLIAQHDEDGAAGKADTNIPLGQIQAGGISQSDGPVNPGHGDDNSYDYVQTKYWTEQVDNSDFKHQRDNPTGKGKPVTNSSAEDNHEYLTVVHEREVNSSKEQEPSTDQIYSIIPEGNNNNNGGVQSVVVYVNQNSVQNPGVEYSDDVPAYANSEAQQQNAMCNDNPAFCDADESPLYENP